MPGAVSDVLDADGTGHRPPCPRATGRSSTIRPFARQQIALPGEPGDGIAAAHQETVAGMRQSARVVAAGASLKNCSIRLLPRLP